MYDLSPHSLSLSLVLAPMKNFELAFKGYTCKCYVFLGGFNMIACMSIMMCSNFHCPKNYSLRYEPSNMPILLASMLLPVGGCG